MTRPQHGQRMFFDTVITRLEEEQRRERMDQLVRSPLLEDTLRANPPGARKMFALLSRRSFLEILRRDTHLFWIDEGTLDSLYNVPHSNVEYERIARLPFPFMFFEFESPIKIKRLNGTEDEVGGYFYCRPEMQIRRLTEIMNRQGLRMGAVAAHGGEFKIDAIFRKWEHEIFRSSYFNISELPNFRITEGGQLYLFDYGQKKLYKTGTVDDVDRSSGKFKEEREEITGFDQEGIESMRREIDLSINIINLINAQNVVVRRQRRDVADATSEGNRLGGRRMNELRNLSPYYWLDLKKSYVSYPDGGDKSWTLDWRVWVRGHFRHYENQQPIWIEHHIRGPENAPWRYHRYAMLYQRLRDTLRTRRDESVGTWAEEDCSAG